MSWASYPVMMMFFMDIPFRSVVVLRAEEFDKFRHGNTLLVRQFGDLRGIRSKTIRCVSELIVVYHCDVRELEKRPLRQFKERRQLMYGTRVRNVLWIELDLDDLSNIHSRRRRQ